MGMPPPPEGLDLTESQVPRMVGVNISTFVVALIALILRFVCRKITRMPIWWDDWLMIPAWLGSLVILITSLWWSKSISKLLYARLTSVQWFPMALENISGSQS